MRIWSTKNLEDIRHEYIEFDGEWYQAFGRPERSGCWIIYGKSGQGKSSFALQLTRKFDEMGMRVMYLTLEMGGCDDFVESVRDVGIHSEINNIKWTDNATIPELDEYLSKQRSPDVVIVDSIQYFEDQCGAKASEIIRLRKKYPSKIFIFLSHVDGREVDGKTAYQVKRDSFKRIHVEGFKATFIGRGKGGPRGYYVIWDKGYQRYWIEDIKNNNSNGTEDKETDQ